MTDVGKHMQECRRSRGPLAEASRCGFTLLEVLVAMTILIVIILIMSTVFNQSDRLGSRLEEGRDEYGGPLGSQPHHPGTRAGGGG